MNTVLQVLDRLPGYWWYSRLTGAALTVAAALGVLAKVTGAGSSPVSFVGVVTSGASGGLILLLWWLTTRCPRTPRGKIGIVIAIVSDEDDEQRRLKTDLVGVLRDLMAQTPRASYFHVLELPPYFASRAVSESQQREVLRRARGHFMVCGTARQRIVGGVPVHLLHLDGLVRHAPVPEAVSETLGAEIGSAIPRRLRIPIDGDALAFETTARWMSIGGRYIIAEAAFLSGDPVLAEELYLDAEHRLKQARELERVLEPVAAALPNKITRLYAVWLEAAYNNYFLSRDKHVLRIVDALSEKLLKRDPTNYNGLLAAGICEFVLRHDLEKALAYINKCEGNRDSTWRISRAFLFAYKGDLGAAHDEYREARRIGISNSNVPLQSEEFINIVLAEEPSMEQLHFCLGLINYNLKQDYEAARRDFDRFLGSSAARRYPDEESLARRLRTRCEKSLEGVG